MSAMICSSESTSSLRVCVVGVGFVGKSLVDVFSEKYRVLGYDISKERVVDLRLAFKFHPRVQFEDTLDKAADCDLFCVSVPTPIGATGDTWDIRALQAALQSVKEVAKPGSTIVIESTVAVGTTRQQLAAMRAKDVFVGFSPERIDPGRVSPSAPEIPKIISGIDDSSLARIRELYSGAFHTVVPVSSVETAEMSKLFENCFRLVNIAYVNEIADACHAHSIDPYEMVEASGSKPYGFLKFIPGLGAGGPCIPANPYYLLINNELPLLEVATVANRKRPARKAARVLESYPVAASILVVGIAFKPGQSLTINSTGLAFAIELQKLGKDVVVYDPLVASADVVTGLPYLHKHEWNVTDLSARFDLVCITMPQQGVDFSVLETCTIEVEWLCQQPLSEALTDVNSHVAVSKAMASDGIADTAGYLMRA